jgi:superoxide dismutase, Fe-Mn family
MTFELPKLPYGFDALEPYIDARTMEIHYTKHHAAYTNNLNNALKDSALEGKSIEEILNTISKQSAALRNNGGGYYNHNLFWTILAPGGGNKPVGELAEAINKYFGSFESFKEKFNTAALTRFGSGWAWLIKNNKGELSISSSPNQDNPLMDLSDIKGLPILNLDVWEHAYYLKYQNRRNEYIEAFWNLVNWPEISKRFLAIM